MLSAVSLVVIVVVVDVVVVYSVVRLSRTPTSGRERRTALLFYSLSASWQDHLSVLGVSLDQVSLDRAGQRDCLVLGILESWLLKET